MPTLKPVNFNPFAKAKTSVPASMVQGAADMASFGFGDEIAAGMGALPGYAMDKMAGGDKSLSETYDFILNRRREQDKQAFEDNPASYIAGGLAGAIATGGAAAGTKAGAALGNSLRAGRLPARVAKGAVAGAASGGLYGAGSATEGERLEGAKRGAAFGAVGGGVIPVAGAAASGTLKGSKNLIKGISARAGEQLDDAYKAIRERSGQAYAQMRDAGALINRPESQKIIQSLESALKKDGPLNARLHPSVTAIIKDIKQSAQKGSLSLEEFEQYRKLLSRVGGNKLGGEDAYKAGVLKDALDSALDALDDKAFTAGNTKALDALKLGRAEYAKSRKVEKVIDVLRRADGDANKIKSGLTSFVNNKKNLRGFTPEEVSALNEAARNTTGEKLLKLVGKFGIDLGSSKAPGNAVAPVVGAVVGGAPAIGAGTAARTAQKMIARGKAEKALQMIERGGASNLPARAGGSAASPIASGLGVAAIPESMPTPKAPVIQPKLKPVDFNPFEDSGLQGSAGGDTLQTSYFDRIAQAESSGNPNAKSKTSSASGLFQFTDGTWRDMVRRHGKATGIQIKDKNNPKAQRVMVEIFTRENAEKLQSVLGREPNDGELYLAHFAGAGGAKRLLTANQNDLAARVLPKAARTNTSIFYDGKRPRTVREVREVLAAKI